MQMLKPVGKFVARVGLALLIVAVFVFGVFPTGRYLDQRNDLDRARTDLEEIQAENNDLQRRVDLLGSDPEIERVARDQYDLVYPDDEVYAVLPPAGG